MALNILNINAVLSYENNANIELIKENLQGFGLKAKFVKEDEKAFVSSIPNYERVRFMGEVSKDSAIYKEAAANAKIVINTKPLINGRFELLLYHNEKSVSISYHRYGNLGNRALKERS